MLPIVEAFDTERQGKRFIKAYVRENYTPTSKGIIRIDSFGCGL